MLRKWVVRAPCVKRQKNARPVVSGNRRALIFEMLPQERLSLGITGGIRTHITAFGGPYSIRLNYGDPKRTHYSELQDVLKNGQHRQPAFSAMSNSGRIDLNIPLYTRVARILH